MLGDILDKFTKSSSRCQEIFNAFGIVVGEDTLVRFQVDKGQNHEKYAPFEDISRNSFAYVSLDNLDFVNRHAHVRASDQGRGLNCTTFMAEVPQPKASKLHENLSMISLKSEETNKQPRDRKFSEDIPLYGNVSYEAILDILSDKESPVDVKYNALQITSAEEGAFKEMASDIFKYCVVKYSTLVEHSCDSHTDNTFMPNLKVFLARKDTVQVEISAKSYIGIIDECCDSVSTVESVLKTLYVRMEVGKNVDHLVVVGDAKSYDYLLMLKDAKLQTLQN